MKSDDESISEIKPPDHISSIEHDHGYATTKPESVAPKEPSSPDPVPAIFTEQPSSPQSTLPKQSSQPSVPKVTPKRFSLPSKTKNLFKTRLLSQFEDEVNDDIDIVSTGGKRHETTSKDMNYDHSKCKSSLAELERSVRFVRTNDPGAEWESSIDKSCWTAEQALLYNSAIDVISKDHLFRLTYSDSNDNPIHLYNIIERSAQQLRLVFAGVFWDTDSIEWLHSLLCDSLSNQYLVIYLQILQHLRLDLQSLIDNLIESCKWKVSSLTTDFWVCLTRKLVEPTSTVTSHFAKLKGNPIILVVPSIGSLSASKNHNRRYKYFLNQFSSFGKVITVNVQTANANSSTPASYLGILLSTLKNKLAEMSKTYDKRPIILVGFGVGSLVCSIIAAQHKVTAVICVGFCLQTTAGFLGNIEDSITQISSPTMFIVGEMSKTCSIDDMEDFRNTLKIENSVLVMGGCNDLLVMNKHKCFEERVTQSMVDKCICNEVFLFLNSLLNRTSKPGMLSNKDELFFNSKSTRASLNTKHLAPIENSVKEEAKVSIPLTSAATAAWKLEDSSKSTTNVMGPKKRGRKPGVKNSTVAKKQREMISPLPEEPKTDHSAIPSPHISPPGNDNEANAAAIMLESLLEDGGDSVPASPFQPSFNETGNRSQSSSHKIDRYSKMPISNGITDLLDSDSESDPESHLLSKSFSEELLENSFRKQTSTVDGSDSLLQRSFYSRSNMAKDNIDSRMLYPTRKTAPPKQRPLKSQFAGVSLPTVVSQSDMTNILRESMYKTDTRLSGKIDATNFSFSQDILSGTVSDLLDSKTDLSSVENCRIPTHAPEPIVIRPSGVTSDKYRVLPVSSSGSKLISSNTKFVFRHSSKLVAGGRVLPVSRTPVQQRPVAPSPVVARSKPDHTY